MTRLLTDLRKPPGSLALSVFVASLFVYAATAARSVYWGDSAELVAVAHTLGIAHPPGYPLYTLLGAFFVRLPLGSHFMRLSLMSAVFASAASAVATLIVWVVSGLIARTSSRPESAVPRGRADPPTILRAAGSLFAGLTLAFGPTVWSQATVPEVYSLSLFLVLAILLLLVRWIRDRPTAGAPPIEEPGLSLAERSVAALGLVTGLALSHHLTAVFLIVPAALVVLSAGRAHPRLRALLAATGLVALGLSFYLYLPIRAQHDPPILWAPMGSWSDVWAHISGAQYASRLFSLPLVAVGHRLTQFARGLPGEVTLATLVLAAVGFVALARRARPLFLAVVAWSSLVVAHAAVYRIPDIASYYIPVYAALSVVAGVGLVSLGRFLPRLPRPAHAPAAWAAVALALAVSLPRVPTGWEERDLSWRQDGRAFAQTALNAVAPGGVVLTLADRIVFPLWYLRFVEGQRPDVAILNVRERAPHLERWFPDVEFPTESELCSSFEEPPTAPGVPARDSVPLGNYLPLLVALNSGERPIYADPDLGRQLFLDRLVPRGVLVEVLPSPTIAIPDDALAAHHAAWERLLGDLEGGGHIDRAAGEAFAVTLAELGAILIERGEFGDATLVLERAVGLAPHVPLCHNNLGAAHDRSGRFGDAVSEFEMALKLDPGLAASHYNIYSTSRRSGDEERARTELEAAVELDPRNASFRIALAALYERSGDPAGAEAMFREASAASPEDWGVRLAFGDFLVRMKRYSEAVGAYMNAEQLMPGEAGALKGLGRCYWALEDRARAIEVMRRLVELQPHNPAPKYDLALMLYRSGRSLEAVSLLSDVTRILPNMWEARVLRASILGELGRHWEARRLFEEALELGARGDAFWDSWSSMERAVGDTVRERAVRERAATDTRVNSAATPPEGGSGAVAE